MHLYDLDIKYFFFDILLTTTRSSSALCEGRLYQEEKDKIDVKSTSTDWDLEIF